MKQNLCYWYLKFYFYWWKCICIYNEKKWIKIDWNTALSGFPFKGCSAEQKKKIGFESMSNG